MSPEIFGLLFVLLVAFAIGSIAWFHRKSRSLLETWAAGNGYTIVDAQRRYLFRGPYFWFTSNGQDVYRVTVRTAGGGVRSGYVRCGGFWMGMLSDKVTVEWDSETRQV